MRNKKVTDLLHAREITVPQRMVESGIVVGAPAVDVHTKVETGSDLLPVHLFTRFVEDFRNGSAGQLRLLDGFPSRLPQITSAGIRLRSSGSWCHLETYWRLGTWWILTNFGLVFDLLGTDLDADVTFWF